MFHLRQPLKFSLAVSGIFFLAIVFSTTISDTALANSFQRLFQLDEDLLITQNKTPDIGASGSSYDSLSGVNALQESDLAVVKTSNMREVIPGDTLLYTINISNQGTLDAETVTMTDTLPAGVTYVSADPDIGTCDHAGGTVNCDLGNLAVITSTLITVTVTVDQTASGSLINTAEVSSATTEIDLNNNSTSATVTVQEADLGIAMVDDRDPVLAGETLSYTLTVTNNGPSIATNIVLTDTLPPEVTFGSVSNSACTHTAGVLTCNFNELAVGAAVELSLDVLVDADFVGTLSNTASVSSDVPDLVTGNDSVTQETIVNAPLPIPPVIEWVSPVAEGETYEVRSGTVNLQVNLYDEEGGSELTDGSVSYSRWDSVSEDWVSIATGVVDPYLAALDVSILSLGLNQISAIGYNVDGIASDESIILINRLEEEADIWVTKTANPGEAVAGGTLVYTIDVGNDGPSAAADVTLTDTLPAELSSISFSTDTGSCSLNIFELTCELGDLASGSSGQVTITVTVDASASGTLENEATVETTTTDPDTASNSYMLNTIITQEADLSIEKVGEPDPVYSGGSLRYQITIENNGPSIANNIQVTDVLTDDVSFLFSTDDSCTHSSSTVTCFLAELAADMSYGVTINVEVSDDFTGTLTNTATVSSATVDPNENNNETTDKTQVNKSPLELKWVSPVYEGSRLEVRNGIVSLQVTLYDRDAEIDVTDGNVWFRRWDYVTERWIYIAHVENALYETSVDVSDLRFFWNEISATGYNSEGIASPSVSIWIYRLTTLYVPMVLR